MTAAVSAGNVMIEAISENCINAILDMSLYTVQLNIMLRFVESRAAMEVVQFFILWSWDLKS